MTHLSRQQSRHLDHLASTRYRMPTLLLMENAARSAAVLAGRLLRDRSGEVLILTGPGNNGGDGWALARFLSNAHRHVTLAELSPHSPPKPGTDAAVQRDIALAMGLEVLPADPVLLARPVALVVDALFGTGLTRPLDGIAATLVHALATARQHRPDLPVLALDLPSGLDADNGLPLGNGPAVAATHTLTFAAPKLGFLNPDSRQYTGEIVIGDIGIPHAAIDAVVDAASPFPDQP